MNIFHLQYPIPLPQNVQPSVMALGFFDGVHLGHQQLLKTAKLIAAEKGIAFSVMTFYPHPREVMGRRQQTGTHITPLEAKKGIFQTFGVDQLFIVQFTQQFGRLSPEQFVEEYITQLGVQHVVAGFDFTFGYKGKGDMSLLQTLGRGKFAVTTVEKIECHQQKISSSLIRELITSGHVEQIPKYLGNHYEVRGFIEPKMKKSNEISINMQMKIEKDYLLPKQGMYIVSLQIDENSCKAICYCDENGGLFIQAPHSVASSYRGRIKMKWLNLLSDSNLFEETKKALAMAGL
jgi:riboflavin kinase / FMN adenylyltransferase